MSPFQQRFQFIEVMITWQGRVNASHLIKYFDISRKQASTTFKKYIANHPQSIIYNENIKGFIALDEFIPQHATKDFSQYHNFVNHSQQPIFSSIAEVIAPTRNPQAHLAQPILRAIEDRLAIDIGYTSLSTPEYKDRIIEPHSLIFDGLRWHVRAYCRKNFQFRDFVLSRFNGEVVSEGKATENRDNDTLWHNTVDIVIEPDQRLSPIQQQVISDDYQMTDNQLIITVRKALANYFIKNMRLDHEKQDPIAQQITLTRSCKASLAPYRYDL